MDILEGTGNWLYTAGRAIKGLVSSTPAETPEVQSKRYEEILKYVHMPSSRTSILDTVSPEWIQQHTMMVVSQILGTIKNDAFSEWTLAAEDAVQSAKVEDTKKATVDALKESASLTKTAGTIAGALSMGGTVFAPHLADGLVKGVEGVGHGTNWVGAHLPAMIGNGLRAGSGWITDAHRLSTGKAILESNLRNASQLLASQTQAFTQSFQANQYSHQSDAEMAKMKRQEAQGKQQSHSGMKNTQQEALTRIMQQRDQIAQHTVGSIKQ
jgi:hypothetical protein